MTTVSATPPWPLIHFDVRCARCDHNLRGQSEPICPACNLEFSWADAVPLEHLTCGKCNYHLYGLSDSRCPECGAPINWNEALLRYRLREKPLFEYRWRDRPIRSFISTWPLTLRPGRLWKTISIHDPPQIAPLVTSLVVFLSIAGWVWPFGIGLMNWWWIRSRGGWPGSALPPTFWDIPAYMPPLTYWQTHMPLLMVFLFGLFAFLALQIFQQSMFRCRIRRIHVLRIVVLGVFAYAPLATLTSVGLETGFRFVRWMSDWERSLMYAPGWIAVQPFIWLVPYALISSVATAAAYRHYLKMPHSFAVATTSMLIALLAVASAMTILMRWLHL